MPQIKESRAFFHLSFYISSVIINLQSILRHRSSLHLGPANYCLFSSPSENIYANRAQSSSNLNFRLIVSPTERKNFGWPIIILLQRSVRHGYLQLANRDTVGRIFLTAIIWLISAEHYRKPAGSLLVCCKPLESFLSLHSWQVNRGT